MLFGYVHLVTEKSIKDLTVLVETPIQ